MELTEHYERIGALGAEVLAISTDDLAGARTMAARTEAEFPVLYDSETGVVAAYGLYDLRGDGVAAPATFIVDGAGIVRWAHVSTSAGDRPTAAEIIAQLEQLDA